MLKTVAISPFAANAGFLDAFLWELDIAFVLKSLRHKGWVEPWSKVRRVLQMICVLRWPAQLFPRPCLGFYGLQESSHQSSFHGQRLHFGLSNW